MLSHFAQAASKLSLMRQFCSHILRGGGDYVMCRTYEAFAAALHSSLLEVLTQVRDMEQLIVQNSKYRH